MDAPDLTQIALSTLVGAPLVGAAILVGVCLWYLISTRHHPRPTRAQRKMWGL